MKNHIDNSSRMLRARYSPCWTKRDWNASVLVGKLETCKIPDLLFSIRRFRRVPLSTVRGQKIYSEYLGEETHAVILENGKVEDNYRTWWNWNGSTWIQTNPTGWRLGKERDPDVDIRLGFLIQEYQYSDHFWHVTLGYPGSLKLKLRTDPEGAREIFRLRDLPAGHQRRAALKHWVTQHHRTRPSTGEKDVDVRKHLRGVEEFTWNGLYCKIAPSLAELNHYWPDQYPDPEPWPEDRRKEDYEQTDPSSSLNQRA